MPGKTNNHGSSTSSNQQAGHRARLRMGAETFHADKPELRVRAAATFLPQSVRAQSHHRGRLLQNPPVAHHTDNKRDMSEKYDTIILMSCADKPRSFLRQRDHELVWTSIRAARGSAFADGKGRGGGVNARDTLGVERYRETQRCSGATGVYVRVRATILLPRRVC